MGCSPWGCYELGTTEWLHFHFSLSCIGEENGNPLQCSCLENPRDGGDWWAAVYGVAQSQTRLKELSSRYHIRRESKCRIVRTVAPINSESMCKSFFCLSHMCMYTPKKVYELFIIFFNLILFFNFTILYWFCHISKWIRHMYLNTYYVPGTLLRTRNSKVNEVYSFLKKLRIFWEIQLCKYIIRTWSDILIEVFVQWEKFVLGSN